VALPVAVVRRRALGLAFLLLLAFLLWLAIAVYNKTFISTTTIYVNAGSVGHQLEVPADVKVRGVLVGTVTKISSNGQVGTLQLSLQPDKVKLIPANVQVAILPKTLFGEKYVDLIIPAKPASTPIAKGAVISQAATSLEVEKVFDDLMPVLDALQPVALNMTLSNLAESLRGRGNILGDNLVRLDTYLKGLNPDLPNVQRDISGLADLAATYDAATPDLLATARQFSTTARTVVQKSDVLTKFLTGTQAFTTEATKVLSQNEQNLVQLAVVNKPLLALLATYSPEFSCMAKGFAELEGPLNAAFGAPDSTSKPALHIRLSLIQQPPAGYTNADSPDFALLQNPNYAGPRCYGLPAIPLAPNARTPPDNGAHGAATAPNTPETGTAVANSDDVARALLAPSYGVTSSAVPGLAVTLLSPQLAGMQVGVS
jgi:phospholipid/cholesterol/gamma-HCH transport system substrate-binding protein